MKTQSIVTLIGASALALCFTACESEQEEMREYALEQRADNLEETADVVRDRGEAGTDATEDAAERKADNLEEKADAVRDQK